MFLYKISRTISFYDVGQKFGVSEPHAFEQLEKMANFIIGRYYFPMISSRWPSTPAACAAAAAAMQARYVHDNPRHQMRRCVGALDGTLIIIWCPSGFNDVYFGRKGFYGINMQAVTNATGHFMWIGGGKPATVWDGNAITDTDFLDTLLPGLPDGYYVICDGGYRADRKLLGPFKRTRGGPMLTEPQSKFNYIHSILRGIVEKAFGILKARFRWMLKGAQYTQPATYVKHFFCAAIVHNMMLDEKLAMSVNEAAAQPSDFDVQIDSDDEDVILEQYKRHNPAMADAVEAFFKEEMSKLRAVEAESRRAARVARRGAAGASGARAGGSSSSSDSSDGDDIPDDAADTLDAEVEIKDKKAGIDLRNAMFNEMGMQDYKASAKEKAAAEARAAKRELHDPRAIMRRRRRATSDASQ